MQRAGPTFRGALCPAENPNHLEGDDGRLVGIDIDRASQVVNLSRLEAVALPLTELSLAGATA